MDKRAAVVLGVIFGSLFLLLVGFMFVAYLAVQSGGHGMAGMGGGPRIGIVEVKGEIRECEPQLKALRDFMLDDTIKAIVVRVDSPGGSVGPSQEIHRAIVKAREKKKVVVSMGGVAASGGYYIAVAGDRIVANAGTITGSIGVISQFPYVGELVHAAKIDFTVLTTGAFKDAGSPLKPMEESERAYFQELIENIYKQFVADVAKGRKLEPEKVRGIADGRVLTGQQALELKLVDQLGNFFDAVELARELSGVEGEPRLVYPDKDDKFGLRALFEDGARAVVREIAPRPMSGVNFLWPGWSAK